MSFMCHSRAYRVPTTRDCLEAVAMIDQFFPERDALGNPIVSDWCPVTPCAMTSGPAHRHSLILPVDQQRYIDWRRSRS